MTMRPALGVWLVLVGVLSAQPRLQPPLPPQPPIAPPGVVMPQPPGRAMSLLPYEGSEIFRFMLHRLGLKPLNDMGDVFQSPAETIIIVHGDSPALRDEYGLTGLGLRNFLQQGGAVLIAGDTRTDGRAGAWANGFGIEREGRYLRADRTSCYREIESRPFARALNRNPLGLLRADSPHLIFANMQNDGETALATDRPSSMYLVGQAPIGFTRIPLASYPITTEYLNGRFPGEKLRFEGCYFAVAYTADHSPGRLLVLADHSVFVNGMTGLVPDDTKPDGLRTDNGNALFIKRATEWLQAGGNEKRTRCLFIEDGQVVNKFAEKITTTMPNQKPPFPPLTPDIVAAFGNNAINAMERTVDSAEERDTFNRYLNRVLGESLLTRWFIGVVSVVLLVALLRRFMRNWWKVHPAAAPPPQTLDSLLPQGGVLHQRSEAQIDVNNFYEAARARVRDRYDRMGGQPSATGTIPPVLIAEGGAHADQLMETIRGLWLIGYGAQPVPIGPGEWDAMNRDLEYTLKLARRGEWSFGQEL